MKSCKTETRKNIDPSPDKKGPMTHPQNQVEYSGHKKDGEPKKVGDGKGHWSGH